MGFVFSYLLNGFILYTRVIEFAEMVLSILITQIS